MRAFQVLPAALLIVLTALPLSVLEGCGGDSDAGTDSGSNSNSANADSPAANPYTNVSPAAGQELSFATLINTYSEGRPDHTPWANTYWPFNSGSKDGIATTAFASGGLGAAMSPAAKYDKAYGCGSQAYAWEKVYHSPSPPNIKPVPVAGWYGHCNGWSASASLYSEPPESELVNGVEFSRSDIKALMTEVGMLVDADYFGHPVGQFTQNDPRTIDDIYPDQFLVVLTNYMGMHKYGINIDRYTGDEIWNQPLVAYKIDYPKPSDYLGADPAAPNVYRIQVTAHLWWADDSANPNDQTPTFDYSYNEPYFAGRDFQAEIWLDGPVVFDANNRITSAGNVVIVPQTGAPGGSSWYLGGTWLGQAATDPVDGHPDFMWVPYAYLDASDTTDNGVNSKLDANPYVDHTWVVDHFYNHAPDDAGNVDCAVNATPSPGPSPHP